jgi:PadR family transcriptional regulator PadR
MAEKISGYHVLTGIMHCSILDSVDQLLLENWKVQLRKGVLEFSVLNALLARPLYGYDIVKRLSAINGLTIPEGTIYPILSRFTRDKLVETKIEESNEGPPRKYYRLSRDGEQLLEKMNQYWKTLKSGVDSLLKETTP